MAKKVIKFYAEWCGPCKVYGPTFERVKQELQEGIEFVEVNVENDPENLSGEFKVRGIPLTVVLEDGEKIREKSGRLSEAELKELILN
jgi:thioredoxin 1